MNNTPTVTYGLEPEFIEKKSLELESFKVKFDFDRLDKVKKNNERLKRYGEKIDQREKLKFRENLNVEEEVLILVGKIKKKDLPGKFYKSSIENKSYFNKNEFFFDKRDTENRRNEFFLAKEY